MSDTPITDGAGDGPDKAGSLPADGVQAAKVSSTDKLGVLRVLIVEDSLVDAQVVVGRLKKGGWKVVSERVETGEAMALALQQKQWDLVVSDHNLPEFSSPEALDILNQSGLDIPFIIVSADIPEGDAIAAMKAGAHDFLMKKGLGRLVPAVERELRDAASRQARRHAEASLLESELRYRSVWENSTDAVLLMDLDGIIRFANPAVERVFGWSSTALIGSPLGVLHGDVQGNGWWHKVRQTSQDVVVDVACRPDGSCVDVEVAFTEMRMGDELWVVAFARDITERRRAEAEIQESREQFAAAREIQQQLLPSTPPIIPGFELAGRSEMAVAAGGDCYDFLRLPDGSLALLVADVSGHGLGAALLMAEARAYLRLLARQSSDPSEILIAACKALAEDLGEDRFITAGLYCLNPATLQLRYASAGHPPAHVLGADGEIRHVLEWTGPPLKRRTRRPCQNGPEVQLLPGDTLLLITDGIDEAMDAAGKECFGLDRAIDVVRRFRHLSAEEIARRLCQAVRHHSAPEPTYDDLTVVIAKVGDIAESVDSKTYT